jgi:general secretion pathway protein D
LRTASGTISGAAAIAFLLAGLSACETRGTADGAPLEPVRSASKEGADGAPLPLGQPVGTGGGSGSVLAGAEIYPGKSKPRQGPSTGPGFSVDDAGEVTLNFVNADIREAIDTILGDMLGVTYVVDPRVTGTITIRTTKPIPQSALIPTLENLLASNGAALVPSDGGFKIQPLDVAATGLPPAQMDAVAAGAFGIHVMPLRFASAVNLQETLQPLIPPGRVLRIDPARNLLIFSGTGIEAAELQDLVSIFDVDWMAGRSFGLFPVEFASPRVIALELGAVFGPVAATGAAGAGAGGAGAIRFLPIERLRAVLAIAGDPSLVEEARVWVERLDRGQEGDGRRIYVYRVQNGRAGDLGRVLGQLFPATVTQVGRDGPMAALAPGLTPTEISAPGMEAAVTPLGDGAAAGVVGPEGTAQSDLTLNAIFSEPTQERRPGIQIVPDLRNNALVISASPEEYRQIETALRQLDVTPLQVMIEATIAEVTLTDQLRYGLQWFFHTGDSNFTFSPLSTGAVAPIFPGFNYALTSANAQVILNALTQITDVKVISSPQLMVLNNETARLQIGDEVPVITQQVQSTEALAPVINSIEYRDTGVILNVSPRVNAGGLVVLDIVQEVSDVVETTTSTLNTPTIQQRQIKSTVAVQSGESVALGGLIRDSSIKGVTGLPIVSEIPILGNLFKNTTDTQRRTELLVLITPRVAASRQDSREITEELRSRVRSLAPLEYRIQ